MVKQILDKLMNKEFTMEVKQEPKFVYETCVRHNYPAPLYTHHVMSA